MENPRILLVDDEPDALYFLKRYLELKGYKDIVTASSGHEALDIIAQKNPHFMLLDIRLGDDIDGMVVLRRTKQLSPKTKVVMVSGHKDDFLEEANSLGAVGFMSKPIKMNDLNEFISLISKS